MSIKVISLVNPYRKMVTGGSEDIRRRIEALSTLYSTEVFAIDSKNEQLINKEIPSSLIINMYERKVAGNPFSWMAPIPVITRYNSKLISDVSESLNKINNNIVLVEGLQSCICWEEIPKYIRTKHYSILRLHNIESEYHKALASTIKNPLLKQVHKATGWQYSCYEPKIFSLFDEIHAISRKEIDKLSELYPSISKKIKWIPPLVNSKSELESVRKKCKERFKIAYFGDLSISLNQEGMYWFLESIWPKVKEQINNVELHIAGHGSGLFSGFDDIIVHGFVNDLDDFINSMDVLIVPIKNGAGVKIKVIDSIYFGKPLVTTSTGIEGTDDTLQSLVWVNDSAESFSLNLVKIYKDYEVAWDKAQEAKKWLVKYYGLSSYLKIFKDLEIE